MPILNEELPAISLFLKFLNKSAETTCGGILGQMGNQRVSKSKVPAKRTQALLIVESQTIGARLKYKLATVNISKSGMLLSATVNGRVPFAVNTILEITVDPGTSILKQPVRCMAKVVRTEDIVVGTKKVPQKFGIQIIPLDESELAQWDLVVAAFEENNSEKQSAA